MPKEREVWDACDKQGNKLGFDLYRDAVSSFPADAYHIVVEVCTFTTGGTVLVTQRHPAKPWGLKWEITGGSILKGETPEQGAVRELWEETGLYMAPSDLHPVYVYCDNIHSIYQCYAVLIDGFRPAIRLQDGETVDFRFVPYPEFCAMIQSDAFSSPGQERLLFHMAELERAFAHLYRP